MITPSLHLFRRLYGVGLFYAMFSVRWLLTLGTVPRTSVIWVDNAVPRSSTISPIEPLLRLLCCAASGP